MVETLRRRRNLYFVLMTDILIITKRKQVGDLALAPTSGTQRCQCARSFPFGLRSVRPPARPRKMRSSRRRTAALASAAAVRQRHRAMRVIKVWETRFISDVLPSGQTG